VAARKVARDRAEETIDAAGNQWFTLRGHPTARAARRPHRLRAERRLARRLPQRRGRRRGAAADRGGRRAAGDVRLVNWADEEGARFGRSLFGSSAAAGSMADQDELRSRKDANGVRVTRRAARARRRPRLGARRAL
jgi:N-carbamoyl-L-amino-acid hydrolase